MRIIHICILFTMAHFVIGQTQHANELVITIETDSLRYNNLQKSVEVPFTFLNGSDDVTLYSLTVTPKPVPFPLTELCVKKGIGTGIAFAVYRPDGHQEGYRITIVDNFKDKPITKERLDSIVRASNERFVRTKKLLLKNEMVSSFKQVDLTDFSLEPGLYFFQLIYYTGEHIANAIGRQEFEKSHSKLFQGCLLSDKVPFIVK